MSRAIRDADFETYDGDKPERANDGYSEAMGSGQEELMDKISSDPLLDMIAGLNADEKPEAEASRKYIAQYLRKYHLLGVIECSGCGTVNYEGDQHCSQCGASLVSKMKMKLSAG